MTYIDVLNLPQINLLAFTATNWPKNCSVSSNIYNDIRDSVDPVMVCRFPTEK
jgi:hypothetical protein